LARSKRTSDPRNTWINIQRREKKRTDSFQRFGRSAAPQR